jgi:RNA polymerase sigma-70 factor, ECF subfamily
MPPEDDASFMRQVEPLRRAIRLHGYRMLGSAHDSDDVVQETWLRAWRAKDSLEDPARLKPWLYRIATNVCLDELSRRPRRLYPTDAFPPTENAKPPLPRVEEPVWLEPMPSRWLEGVDDQDPQARYALKESVALAFVAALQCLPPLQRATLLLRDVVGLSAIEAAAALGLGVEATNSALFRARTGISDKLGGSEAADIAAASQVDSQLLEQYVRAFEEANLDALVALFHADIRTTMPPAPTWVAGRAANERFYRLMFGHISARQFLHVLTSANGQPALAFYRPAAPGAAHQLAAIQLVTTKDGGIAGVDHFMLPEVYPLFDVPRELS